MESTCGPLDDIDQILSSPLKRCLNFAKSWSAKKELPLDVVAGFREAHFGEWDGMSLESLWGNHREPMSRFWHDAWHNPPPNAESPAGFSDRVTEALEVIMRRYPNHNALLIAHGGVIRTLIGWCLSLDLRGNAHLKHLAIDYGSLSLIEIYRDQATQQIWPRLIFSNYRSARTFGADDLKRPS